jgi:hypothetical protein
MIRTYFTLDDDVYLEGRWFLNGLYDAAGTHLDSRDFTYGRPMNVGPPLQVSLWNDEKIIAIVPPLRVSRRRDGYPLDFTYADGDMPVVTTSVGNILASFAEADIQRFPVQIDQIRGDFEIINVVSLVDCIDVKRSEIQWFAEGNDVRPDLAGTPEMITKLIIDPNRVSNECHVFRVEGWDIAVIVSDLVKNAIEDAGVSGIRFRQV